MGFLNYLKRIKDRSGFARWLELGPYQATFRAFGEDMYKSDTVRACVRPLAEFTSKAEARCNNDPQMETMLNVQPNIYMTGNDFLYKIRTIYEIKNTVFILIMRDDRGRPAGLYPVPYISYEALEYQNGLFIRFSFAGELARELVFPWEDLVVLRKDYLSGDIGGDDNRAILQMLDVLNTANQGVANAIKTTANLRGLLKSTKAMLAPEDVRKQKELFVKDYMSLENEGGIASLDATMEFTPIRMEPTVANYAQLKEMRENIQRYFGVNDKVVTGDMTPDELGVLYELRIEPFLVALSKALTGKMYTAREQAFGRWVVYEANRLQFASLDKKIQLFKEVVLYGGMTTNEWRIGCNMAPIDGGDERIMRKDAGTTQKGRKEEEQGDGNQE